MYEGLFSFSLSVFSFYNVILGLLRFYYFSLSSVSLSSLIVKRAVVFLFSVFSSLKLSLLPVFSSLSVLFFSLKFMFLFSLWFWASNKFSISLPFPRVLFPAGGFHTSSKSDEKHKRSVLKQWRFACLCRQGKGREGLSVDRGEQVGSMACQWPTTPTTLGHVGVGKVTHDLGEAAFLHFSCSTKVQMPFSANRVFHPLALSFAGQDSQPLRAHCLEGGLLQLTVWQECFCFVFSSFPFTWTSLLVLVFCIA